MAKNVHFVGLDIACDDFAASIYLDKVIVFAMTI